MTAHLLLTKCRPGSLGANEQSNGVGLFVGEPEHRWLKTDQQVRLHLNRFPQQQWKGKRGQAWLSMFSSLKIKHADKSFHMIPPCISNKQWDDVLKISQERNYPRNAAADSKQEFFFTSSSHLSAREYIFLSVYSRFILLQPAELTFCRQSTVRKYSITMNQIRHHRHQTFLLPSHPESGSWLVGCVSRQN